MNHCGACCIIPSISSPIPGMPNGKPAGTPCIHLTENYACALFNSDSRPKVCSKFTPEEVICGNSPQEARENLKQLEESHMYFTDL